MPKKVIIYPIFMECCKYTFDEYWIKILENCSYNNFPKTCKYDYDNHTLKIKGEDIVLPKEDDKLYKILKKLFMEKLDMYSQSEMIYNGMCKTPKSDISLWKKIKSKNIKDDLLTEFVYEYKEKYQLSDIVTTRLYNKLQLGIQYKNILSEDIICENGKIKEIKNVNYNVKKQQFTFLNDSIVKNVIYSKVKQDTNSKSNIDQYITKFINKKL